MRGLLSAGGIASDEEPHRGLDHGVFVPFKVMYPAADVPMVQLSLNRNRDASTHLALGRALAPLRDEDVLIVGSGMSYHNLREFFVDRPEINQAAEAFDAWLDGALAERDPAARAAKLEQWREAPGARACHPTPEHLLPLLVAAGAAGDSAARRTYHDRLMGKAVSGFQFGYGRPGSETAATLPASDYAGGSHVAAGASDVCRAMAGVDCRRRGRDVAGGLTR